ncbi:hypothetical protein KKG08_01005 [Patescibacteria group bacterium]|nr:hypothetical protein [Patescibacteria group bacterium]
MIEGREELLILVNNVLWALLVLADLLVIAFGKRRWPELLSTTIAFLAISAILVRITLVETSSDLFFLLFLMVVHFLGNIARLSESENSSRKPEN